MAKRNANDALFARLAHRQGRISDADLRRFSGGPSQTDGESGPPAEGEAASTKKRRASAIGPEEAQQRQVIQWADVTRIPADAAFAVHALDPADRHIGAWLYHAPNGGSRTAAEAGRLKAMGQRPGVPDLTLALPVQGFAGLYLEMKAPGRRSAVSRDQVIWHRRLHWAGYAVRVADCFDEACAIIVDYLRGRLAIDATTSGEGDDNE